MNHDDLARENESLRERISALSERISALSERISALSAASLRVGASLDLDTVLQEVVESARALTGARYGAIATIDEAGQPRDFVTSGFTDEEHRRMQEWPDGPRLFEYFRDLPGPLRLDEATAHVRALGFDSDRLPWGTFQGTPMRHQGVHVGNFYLVDKEGGQAFTGEDEEVLVLFASQAAAAIANARTHRAEQQARADLEAPGRDLAGRRRGVRCPDRRPGVAQPRGDADRRQPAPAGPHRRGPAPGDHLPARRRARDRARPVPALGRAEQRRDGARRGGRALGSRRAQHHHADQRDADPRGADRCRGRRRRLGGGHHAGPGAAPGAGAHAGGVPRHGEPRAAHAADLDQGLDRHGARRRAALRCGRDAAVLPHHRRAGRPHERAYRRPARRRQHRRGHAVGGAGALRGGARWSTGRAPRSCPAAPGTPC